MNRRGFLSSGMVAAGAVAAPLVAHAKPCGPDGRHDIKWQHEADVVILGSGLAGCVTAIAAHDADPSAKIVIVEKMPERYAGGNSRVAGQSIFLPTDLEQLMIYRRHLDQPNPIPEPVLRAWAEAMVSQHDWIRSMMSEAGFQLVPHKYNKEGVAEYAEFPGSSSAAGKSYLPMPLKSGVWQAFKNQVDRRPVQFMYETRALELVQDEARQEVFGVLVEQGGKQLAIKARRAVVMCTGGFENNLDMHRNYSGMNRTYPLGTPGNTGDGIKMLQKAGAELWHLRNSVITSGMYPAMKFDEFPCAFLRHKPAKVHGWIDLAKDNRRFWDETRDWNATHYHEKKHGHWVDAPLPFAQPVHMIFDEATRPHARLSYGDRQAMTWNNVVENYIWSADNSVEIAKGWIKTGATLAELAAKIGRDPAQMEAAVARYNKACETGTDDEFGRDPATLQPIVKAPFYAVEIVPGTICTTGGGRRDENALVQSQNGKAIRRLYEAGELGSTMGNLYQNGSFLTECIVFGRIAGRNAVAEKAWETAS